MARTSRREKFPILPVLESLGQLIPGGSKTGTAKAKCSFHDDQIASAVVDYRNQRFRCYACGEAGDSIELIMRHEGLPFAAAVERCEEITGQAKSSVRSQQSSGGGLFDDAGYSD